MCLNEFTLFLTLSLFRMSSIFELQIWIFEIFFVSIKTNWVSPEHKNVFRMHSKMIETTISIHSVLFAWTQRLDIAKKPATSSLTLMFSIIIITRNESNLFCYCYCCFRMRLKLCVRFLICGRVSCFFFPFNFIFRCFVIIPLLQPVWCTHITTNNDADISKIVSCTF